MKAGRVPTAVVGPVIGELISELWPDENGYQILADAVGCDQSAVWGVVHQRNAGADFDLVDGLLCKLGRSDLWLGALADIYPTVFWSDQHRPRVAA